MKRSDGCVLRVGRVLSKSLNTKLKPQNTTNPGGSAIRRCDFQPLGGMLPNRPLTEMKGAKRSRP